LLVCEELSKEFGLHLLNRSGDVRTCIVADYGIGQLPSRRMRQSHEQAILAAHRSDIRVLELTGALSFANMDYISRRLAITRDRPLFVLLDFSRVPTISHAAATLFGEFVADLSKCRITTVLSGISAQSANAAMVKACLADTVDVRSFATLDQSIEWAEDQVIYRHGGFTELAKRAEFSNQALLAGFSAEELKVLADLTMARSYKTGERIIAAHEPASSVFLLQSGMVSVKAGNGTRLASLVPGMTFGEMALIEGTRLADVYADTPVECLELSIERFNVFRAQYPYAGERMMRNLAVLLAQRLAQANTRVDLLSAHWQRAEQFDRSPL
jgi:glutaminase